MRHIPHFIRFLLYVLIAYLLYIRLRLIFSYSLDLDGSEYAFVHQVQFLLQGRSLYQNPFQFPYTSCLYPPGYVYVLYYIALIFKWNYINNIHEILIAGRSISFLFMFLNIFFIYKCLKQIGTLHHYILPLIALYLLLITGHFYAMRPDAIKTTLFAIIVFILLKFIFFRAGLIYLLWFNLAVILSVIFKQDSIINIFLLSVLLLITVQNKRSAVVLITAIISVMASFASLYFICGKYFFANIIMTHFQQITDIAHSYNLPVMLFSAVRLLPLGAVAVYSFWLACRKRHGDQLRSFLPFAAVSCFIVASLGMLRTGSYLNYSFEPSLLLILNFGIFATAHKSALLKYGKLYILMAGAYMLLLLSTNTLIHSYSLNSAKEDNYRREYFTLLKDQKAIATVVQNDTIFFLNPKYCIFSNDKQLVYGYDMHINRLIEVFTGFHVESRILFASTEPYDKLFTDGTVKFIIAGSSLVDQGLIERYYKHFHQAEQFDNFVIYKYQP